MASNIQSLGDEPAKGFVLLNETRPMPGNRQELVSAFSGILSLGKVQMVHVEVGQEIKFSRYVQESLADPKELGTSEDPFEIVMNGVIEELNEESFSATNSTLHELLFFAFAVLEQKRMKPETFFVGKMATLKKSLGLLPAWNLKELFGVPLMTSEQVPEGVLLLSGSVPGEKSKKFSLRILMPARKS